MIRLKSLSITQKPGGLYVPRYEFGSFLTLLRAPNDAGKTPLMCALFWALGGCRHIDEPLRSLTDGVSLELEQDGCGVKIHRSFSSPFRARIEVTKSKLDSQEATITEYNGESEFSSALLEMLNIPQRSLLNKQGALSSLYMSILAPVFAVDQDSGWTLPYVPYADRNFIQDQKEEVARIILNVGPRHDPVTESAHNLAVAQLQKTQDEIALRANSLAAIERSLAKQGDIDIGRLTEVRQRLLTELRNFDSVINALSEVDSSLRQRMHLATQKRDSLRGELESLRIQRNTLKRLMEESAGDLALLSSNEVAADAFRRFCGNTNCQFFMVDQKASFGRRVLYWRDQLKDVMHALEGVGGEINQLTNSLAEAEIAVRATTQELEKAANAKGSERVIAAISAVTQQLADVGHRLESVERLEEERARYGMLLEKEDKLRADVSSLEVSKRGKDDLVTRRRKVFQTAIARWSDLLRVRDVGTIAIDERFRLCVDGSAISDRSGPSGSTRTRLVLAYHAAMLEASLIEKANHPPFLLLDSPKQQEIEPRDIAAFVAELRNLAGSSPRFQLVIASRTDISHNDNTDIVWSPKFRMKNQARYAGRVDGEGEG